MSPTAGVGVVLRDIPVETEISSLTDALRLARRHGVRALQLPSVTWLSAGLRPAELAAAQESAAEHEVELTATLGTLNGCLPERNARLAELGDGDVLRGVARAAQAAQHAGIETMHATCGALEDRVRPAVPWHAQLAAHAGLVGSAAAVLADLGIRLVLKTHEEMSSWDVLAVLEAAGNEVRVGFSPVNLLVGMEDGVAAARRLAPFVHTAFLDDAALVRTPRGLRRSMQAVGDGVLEWTRMLATIRAAAPADMRLTLDLHRARFEMPFFEQDWARLWPELPVDEFARGFARARAEEIADAEQTDRFTKGLAAASHWADVRVEEEQEQL